MRTICSFLLLLLLTFLFSPGVRLVSQFHSNFSYGCNFMYICCLFVFCEIFVVCFFIRAKNKSLIRIALMAKCNWCAAHERWDDKSASNAKINFVMCAWFKHGSMQINVIWAYYTLVHVCIAHYLPLHMSRQTHDRFLLFLFCVFSFFCLFEKIFTFLANYGVTWSPTSNIYIYIYKENVHHTRALITGVHEYAKRMWRNLVMAINKNPKHITYLNHSGNINELFISSNWIFIARLLSHSQLVNKIISWCSM